MRFGRKYQKEQSRVIVKDTAGETKTAARQQPDGQIDVKFYSSPQQLTKYVSRFESVFAQHKDRRPPRRPSLIDSAKPPPPTPRLSIAIHVVGSRGDVQPFIPIAQILIHKYGHRVRICTHPNFKEFVESHGIEFFSIGGDPEALMAYMVKNPGLLPSRKSLKAGEVGKRVKEMGEILSGTWRSCIEAGDGLTSTPVKAADVGRPESLFLADMIIANPPSMGHIHCAEKLNVPLHMVFTMPWSPTSKFHHPLAAMDYGEADQSTGNYLSFMLMELLTWQG